MAGLLRPGRLEIARLPIGESREPSVFHPFAATRRPVTLHQLPGGTCRNPNHTAMVRGDALGGLFLSIIIDEVRGRASRNRIIGKGRLNFPGDDFLQGGRERCRDRLGANLRPENSTIGYATDTHQFHVYGDKNRSTQHPECLCDNRFGFLWEKCDTKFDLGPGIRVRTFHRRKMLV